MDCFNRIWRTAICTLQPVLLTCQPFNAIIPEIYPSFKVVIQEDVHDLPQKKFAKPSYNMKQELFMLVSIFVK